MATQPQPAQTPSQLQVPELSTLQTPAKCSADICVLPIGTGNPSVANEVAQIQLLLRKTKLSYVMHAAGTTIDGAWDEVMDIIGKMHTMLHQAGVVRIQSDIRVGTRIDKPQTHHEKVAKIQKIIGDRNLSSTPQPGEPGKGERAEVVVGAGVEGSAQARG